MSTYLAVVFASESKAYAGLHRLWQMDDDAEITIHGAAIVRRDMFGHLQICAERIDIGIRTAIGMGAGALLGLLAGPLGALAGAGLGALAGGAMGFSSSPMADKRRDLAEADSFFTLKHGQSAIIAVVSEMTTDPLDQAMISLGGALHRQQNIADHGDHAAGQYLSPYDYQPIYG